MQEYIDFVVENPLYFIGLIIVIGMLIKIETARFTRKFKMLNTNEAVKLMNNDETIIVDVREDKEIKDGIIKNAQHITLGQLPDRIGLLGTNKQAPILVYCRSGTRSSTACNTITKAGFEDVSSIKGGVLAWEAANLPTVKR
ncbi:MAG: rhodanese-related sulfurtransferase [Cocleimonas sp.]|jgi:rhodanese-related sulfurtransferase